MVLIGNLGGTLQAGRYVEYPYWGLLGHKTTGNLYATLLHAVGERCNTSASSIRCSSTSI